MAHWAFWADDGLFPSRMVAPVIWLALLIWLYMITYATLRDAPRSML